jgi:tagatose 6-phosphate kinase
MIVTVTPNSGLDHCLLVDHFKLNATLRVKQSAWGMGAKPLTAAWTARLLGADCLALGFAAGPTGSRLQEMLLEAGIQVNFTQVDGDTRSNTVVISADGQGQSTLTVNSLRVQPEHIDQLIETYQKSLAKADCVVLGGSLPEAVSPSLYATLVAEANQQGVPTVFDASGQGLRLGLQASPTIAKPNQQEIGELTGEIPGDLPTAYRLGQALRQQFGVQLVVTLGKLGALALLSQRTYYIPPIKVPVVSTAGAGDAILAGLALGMARQQPVEESLRLAFAAATASLLTLATGDCQPEDVRRLLPQISLQPYPD